MNESHDEDDHSAKHSSRAKYIPYTTLLINYIRQQEPLLKLYPIFSIAFRRLGFPGQQVRIAASLPLAVRQNAGKPSIGTAESIMSAPTAITVIVKGNPPHHYVYSTKVYDISKPPIIYHPLNSVASMPNTGVEEEYYRLRHFSITGKGVVNRGDSLKSKRSRSNNSVASSNSR